MAYQIKNYTRQKARELGLSNSAHLVDKKRRKVDD